MIRRVLVEWRESGQVFDVSMSDEECIPPKSVERSGRANVEVRVIGGRMGDFRGRNESESEWDEGEIEEPGEVTRLERDSGPLANRRLEDEERVDPVPLSGQKGRMSLLTLTSLMAGVAVLLTVGVVSLALAIKKDPPGQVSIVEVLDVVSEEEKEAAAAAELVDAEKLMREAIDLFALYFKAKSVDEVVGLIRDGERLRPMLEEKWKPMAEEGDFVVNLANKDGRVYIVLRERDAGDADREYIFVMVEGELELDWEASLAVGDVEFDELESIKPGRTVKMRVVLRPSDFHPVEYPDDEFRCYRILLPGSELSLYGYARLGSEVVADLSEALNEGSVLFGWMSTTSVIVNLKNNGRGEFGQFEISDVLENGWIEP